MTTTGTAMITMGTAMITMGTAMIIMRTNLVETKRRLSATIFYLSRIQCDKWWWRKCYLWGILDE